MPETWLTVKEAAALWRVCPRTIDRMAGRGEITLVRLRPRLKRVLVYVPDEPQQQEASK